MSRLQPVGVAEAGVGREVGRDVVAPRAAERVLHHRHELDVREAEVAEVGRRGVGDLVPVVEVAAVVLAPRREVHLVDRHRPRRPAARHARGDPLVVAPDVGSTPRRPRPSSAASRRSGPSGRPGRPTRRRRRGCGTCTARPTPTPGTNACQTPESPTRAIGCARPVPAGPLAGHLDLQRVGCPDAEGRAAESTTWAPSTFQSSSCRPSWMRWRSSSPGACA